MLRLNANDTQSYTLRNLATTLQQLESLAPFHTRRIEPAPRRNEGAPAGMTQPGGRATDANETDFGADVLALSLSGQGVTLKFVNLTLSTVDSTQN